MSEGARKDKWDKLAIVLAPVGGLLTAGAIAIFGFVTSNVLNRRQASETNTRLYSELMSKREESESALRKDMFVSIINSFLAPGGSDLGAAVLNLELLAYNFHESLNLKPLFLDLKRRIDRAEVGATPAARADLDDYSVRLERVAREIARKQLIVLEGVGRKFDRTIDMTVDPIGTSLEPATLALEDSIPTTFSIDILDVDRSNREVKVGLNVETPDPVEGRQTKTATFVVSFFDFPMIDNTRLAHGQRCAIILNGFSEQAADVTLVLFPGEYASLKEKPYYSEVLEKVRSASEQAVH